MSTASSIIDQFSGRAIPVRGNDIDTDRIIPARFLRCVTFEGLGEHAFADDRADEKRQGRIHPFDEPRYAGAEILVVNANFGCGSSREHAPQSIQRWGINAIIGVSFAEIFFGNCVALGLPCLSVSSADAEAIQSLIEGDPSLQLRIDIASGSITVGERSFQGSLPAGAKSMFLSGHWDATGQLIDGKEDVATVAAGIPYMNGFQ
ncbi:MAG: 3-isopropylmalate dehydratase small subunit [Planctomycetota bacterium]|nr:MAG: 3-isopropylmalate dehydratase small subunit [Planctomycetota bacterium]